MIFKEIYVWFFILNVFFKEDGIFNFSDLVFVWGIIWENLYKALEMFFLDI